MMNCAQVRSQLSAYHDDELPGTLRRQVADHMQQCTDCTRQLRDMRQLHTLATAFEDLDPPPRQWREIQRELRRASPSVSRTGRIWPHRLQLVIAVSILLGVGGLVTVFRTVSTRHTTNHNIHLVANFGRFLDQFEQDPAAAQAELCRNYEGRRVTAAEAARLTDLPTLSARKIPAGYSIDSIYVLDMPCCRCMETIYCRGSGGRIAVFEHLDDKTNWFGNRPAMMADCCGMRTSIVQMDRQLAVTWKQGRRRFTAVGVKDIAELAQLIEHLQVPI